MLSVIIINYHSYDLLDECLRSIYTGEQRNDFEVLVADNSPSDGAGGKISGLYPSVKWLTMPGNIGFARANNAAIKVATGDAVLLLNPDTIIKEKAIANCYHRLMASAYTAAGVQLLNVDGSPQISGNYIVTGGLNLLMQVPYFGNLLRLAAKKAGVTSTNLPEAKEEITEVDWINGAFLMVKKSAIEKAGLLDEDFFLYHEESEWCSRLKKFGKLCIYGNLHVIHLEGQSSNKAFQSSTSGYSNLSDRKGYQLMLSMFVRIRKEFGAGWYLFHLLCYTLCLPFVVLIALFESIIKRSLPIFKSTLGFAANIISCWQYFFTIMANKPCFYKVL